MIYRVNSILPNYHLLRLWLQQSSETFTPLVITNHSQAKLRSPPDHTTLQGATHIILGVLKGGFKGRGVPGEP